MLPPQIHLISLCICFKPMYSRMVASLEKILVDDSDQPKLVIVVDKAHPLNEYSHHKIHAVWVVFTSRTSKVADFSLPNQKRP